MSSNQKVSRDWSFTWSRVAWITLAITAVWAVVMYVVAQRARDWRMLSGMVEELIWLAGVVLGLGFATIFAMIGAFSKGRYRRRALMVLCVCVLAWVAPFIVGALSSLWPDEDVKRPPAPAHGDMLGFRQNEHANRTIGEVETEIASPGGSQRPAPGRAHSGG
jgi:hypothetical protein